MTTFKSPDGDKSGIVPEHSSVEVIGLSDFTSEPLRAIVDIWRNLAQGSPMPAREAISLRAFGRYVSHISVTRVVDDGADFEFRIVGDAHVQAYDTSYRGRMLSEIIEESPEFGRQLRECYEAVRVTQRPLAFRGVIGRDFPDCRFVRFETVYLPLGSAGTVDHIINAAVYNPRNGGWST